MPLQDRTSEFRKVVKNYSNGLGLDVIHEERQQSDFTKQASAIEQTLRELQRFLEVNTQPYLATHRTAFREVDRNAVDTEIASTLQECDRSIVRLKNSIRRWKEGEIEVLQHQAVQHHDLIVRLLDEKKKELRNLSDCLRSFRYKRLKREEEWQKRFREKIRQAAQDTDQESTAEDVRQDFVSETSYSGKQKALLEAENQQLVEELEATLDKARHLEKSIMEISVQSNQFASLLLVQDKQVENLTVNAIATGENIRQGNKQLAQAIDRGVSWRIFMLIFMLSASMILYFVHIY